MLTRKNIYSKNIKRCLVLVCITLTRAVKIVQFGHTPCIKALATLKGDVNQVAPLL